MFCPHCGVPEQSPDAYCKKCGTYLRDVSFRGWWNSGNNPERAAWSILASSIFIAILCVCIGILILSALRSGDLSYLKYAFALCGTVIGVLVTLSVMGFRLWSKMRRARSSLDESASAIDSRGVAASPGQHMERLPGGESSGEAATELLSSRPREIDKRKQTR